MGEHDFFRYLIQGVKKSVTGPSVGSAACISDLINADELCDDEIDVGKKEMRCLLWETEEYKECISENTTKFTSAVTTKRETNFSLVGRMNESYEKRVSKEERQKSPQTQGTLLIPITLQGCVGESFRKLVDPQTVSVILAGIRRCGCGLSSEQIARQASVGRQGDRGEIIDITPFTTMKLFARDKTPVPTSDVSRRDRSIKSKASLNPRPLVHVIILVIRDLKSDYTSYEVQLKNQKSNTVGHEPLYKWESERSALVVYVSNGIPIDYSDVDPNRISTLKAPSTPPAKTMLGKLGIYRVTDLEFHFIFRFWVPRILRV
ncbi:8132_t:CDS:2 [Acaulospora morrowiae]|uniref:8132_t:CDS:1 n=1 Tax=Acaulospora morrowiae TaxID=94023 RepID=A0A9N9F033_9GLOM|nr:8132_t:CDS:2 [Acaulospora morrowiae]